MIAVLGVWPDGTTTPPLCNVFRCSLSFRLVSLSVGCVGAGDRGQLRLPLVTVGEKLLLVVEQLLPGLHGVFGVGALDNGVHGA